MEQHATRLVFERWPRLAELPWTPIADLPTPVEHLAQLSHHTGSQVWCKHDDVAAALYGGNKARKLEWLLADARRAGARAVVTVGALGSHHVLATSIYAARLGIEVHAILTPQTRTDHVEANFRLIESLGTRIHRADSIADAIWRVLRVRHQLRRGGERPYWIPPGGSSPVGSIGYVEAALELASQIHQGVLPKPEAIYITLGSGGTVAGLAVGLAAVKLAIPIHAVRVVSPKKTNPVRLAWLIHRIVSLLRRHDGDFPAVESEARRLVRLDAAQLGPGYGEPTPASQSALDLLGTLEHLQLDGTYTAKTMAALLADAPLHAGKPILYWHTLSHPPSPTIATV